MTNRENELLTARIIPPVKKLELTSEQLFKLTDGCSIKIKSQSNAEEIHAAVLNYAKTAWKIVPKIMLIAENASTGAEGYELDIDESEIVITAGDVAGILNAMKTLRQLAETERGTLRSSHSILPSVKIKDAPVLKFRGMHFCWFPETPLWEIEKQIRMAAYYKFNYAVIESWGVLRFNSHPEFCWDEFAVEPKEMKRLVRLGKELGITLIPQINIFGHATASRCGTGKHAILDFHPEFGSLFEPDGWTWCISNPAARDFLQDIVLEAYELFDCPEFFHIGCDEAYNAGSCTSCRRSDYPTLLKEHILFFRDLLAERNVRVMMWHDMLLQQDDPRWENYVACGSPADNLENLYKELPKDIIICDWQYYYSAKEQGKDPEWPTPKFFKEAGYEVLVCPWNKTEGIESLGQLAETEQLLGMLETTWNLNHSFSMFHQFVFSAHATWCPSQPWIKNVVSREFFNRHLREIGHDAGGDKYIQTGSVQYQVNIHDYQPG